MSIHIVTGAFGYSGKYIAARLLRTGVVVRTITNSVNRQNPFGDKVEALPFHFDNHRKMVAALAGGDVLYNTYWVRFNHDDFTYSMAVENTVKLFAAAKEAGVRRVVHISITNPSEDSELEYFSGKARLERQLIESGLSYSILRPTILFGKEDILINNIAWVLRHLPAFGVFGDGEYRLQPIYVADLASLAVMQGAKRDNVIIDAIGPETFTYRNLVRVIGEIIGKKRPIISVSPFIGFVVGWVLSKFVGDVMITREEIKGLMAELLYVDSPPVGDTRLTDWIRDHADSLGEKYTSELARRKDRMIEYRSN